MEPVWAAAHNYSVLAL